MQNYSDVIRSMPEDIKNEIQRSHQSVYDPIVVKQRINNIIDGSYTEDKDEYSYYHNYSADTLRSFIDINKQSNNGNAKFFDLRESIMKYNIFDLIDNKPLGSFLSVKGGYMHSWSKWALVKTSKSTLSVSLIRSNYSPNSTWYEMPKPNDVVCTITKEKITFKLFKYENERSDKNNHNYRDLWIFKSLLSLNLVYNAFVVTKQGYQLLHTNDGLLGFQDKFEFDWKGNFIGKVTKKAQAYKDFVLENARNRRNSLSRARYQFNKASNRLKKAKETHDWSKIEYDDVFKLRNVSERREIIEHFGMENILKQYPTKVLNKDTIDGREYELVEISIPQFAMRWDNRTTKQKKLDEKPSLYLKMINPSTGEYHLEGIPSKEDSPRDYIPENTVRGALAWRDGDIIINHKEKNPNRWWNNVESITENYIEPVVLK